jgi:predicted amidohydrolase YtcJ
LASVEQTTREAKSCAGEANVIFYGGSVLTANNAQPRAEALAVRRGIISTVGKTSDVMAQRGPRTRMVNLGGHALLPGFIDAHMHTAITIIDDWLDIGPFTTKNVDEALEKVKSAAAKAKPGEWVLAKMFDPHSCQVGPSHGRS